jgi:WD40 repeat protein
LGTTRLLHADFVTAGALSPDGRRFASSAIDGSLIVWEWPSGKSLHTFSFQSRDFPCLLFSPKARYVAAFAEKNLIVWDLTSGRAIIKSNSTHKPTFSQDSKYVAWLKDAQTIYVRDLGTPKEPVTFSRDRNVLSLGYDSEGCLVIAEDGGKAIALRDCGTEKQFRQIDTEDDPPLWTDFTPDASCFAIQTKKSGFRVFNVRTGNKLGHLAALPQGFSPSVLGKDGKTLLLQSRSRGTIQHWDLVSGKHICTLDMSAGEGGILVGAFSPDGKLVAVGGTNHHHAAFFCDAQTGKRLEVFPGNRDRVQAIAFSPDGKEVAVCGSMRGDPMVRIWDPETGRLLRSFAAHPFGVDQVVYTPDGSRLVTCGMGGKEDVCVWDARKLTKLHAFKIHRYGAGYIAVSPDGERVVSIGRGTTPDDAALWDLKTGKRLLTHPAVGTGLWGVTFLPGGRTLAACDSDRIRYWKVKSEALDAQGELQGKSLPNAFSPDGRVVIVTDSVRDTTRLVEVVTGKDIGRLADNAKNVWAAFAPDGRTIAWGCDDGVIRLFDWSARVERLAFEAHQSGVHCLTFSPDGKRLASVGSGIESAPVIVWDVSDVTNCPLKRTTAKPKQIDTWCAELAGPGAPAAYRAVWALAGAPEQALTKLKALMTKPAPPALEKISQWIADLDDDDFSVRQSAEKELLKAGNYAKARLEDALADNPSLEQKRRLQRILRNLSKGGVDPDTLFAVRGVLVVEQIGSPKAQELLRDWAKGPPEARLTREAKAALQRLEKRTNK